MQNLWAKDIAECIPTALCSFLHSDLICYMYTTWSMFNRQENTHTLRVVVSWIFQVTIWKRLQLQKHSRNSDMFYSLSAIR